MLDMLSAAAAQGAAPGWTGFLPIIGMIAIFWFLLIRPQMRQQKQHREKIAGVKKGDQVVTGGGLVGKVTKVVDDNEVEIDLGGGTKVTAVRSTIAEVRVRGEPVANQNAKK